MRWHALYLLLVVAVAGLLYTSALAVPFQFDDFPGIFGNPSIVEGGDLFALLGSGDPPRPVLNLTYALNYRMGGASPTGYHLVNGALHAANSLLVYLLVHSLMRFGMPGEARNDRFIAFWAALLFAAHPAQTEAVTYIWGRSTLLYTFFYLAALVLFITFRESDGLGRRGRFGLYVGSVAMFAAALGTKATALSLPAVLLLFELCFGARGDIRAWRRRVARVHLPFLVLAGLRLLFHLIEPAEVSLGSEGLFAGATLNWPAGLTAYSNLLTQYRAFFRSIGILALPVDLNVDRDFRLSSSLLEPAVLASLIGLCALVVLAVFAYKRSRIVAFSLLWLPLTMSLFFVVPLPDYLVERRLYPVSVGFCLLVALGVWKGAHAVAGPSGRRARAVSAVALTLLVGLGSIGTLRRNAVWKEEVTLWRDSVSKSPNKARPHANLAQAYFKRGSVAEGILEAQRAIDLGDRSGIARKNLIAAYLQTGRESEAAAEFRSLLAANPVFGAQLFIGNRASPERRAFDGAVLDMARELEVRRGSADAHAAVGLMLLAAFDQRERGLRHLEEGIRLGTRELPEHELRKIADEAAGR